MYKLALPAAESDRSFNETLCRFSVTNGPLIQTDDIKVEMFLSVVQVKAVQLKMPEVL